MKVGHVPTEAMASGVEAMCDTYTVLRPTSGGSNPLGGSDEGEPSEHEIQAYLETPSPEVEQTYSGEQISDMVTFRSPVGTDVQKEDQIPYQDVEYEVDSVTGMPTNDPSELKITAVRRS